MALRAATAILYVRARIHYERGAPVSVAWVALAHSLALVLVLGLSALGLAPRLAVAAFSILLMRAAWGLMKPSKAVRAQVVGAQEVAFGLMTLLLVATGFSTSFD